MSNCFTSLIVSTDFLGQTFDFYINGQYRYKTLAGGILSIFLTLSLLILGWYFGQDIYLKKSPQMLTKTEYLTDYPLFNVTQQNYSFAYRVEDGSGTPVFLPQYFEYKFSLISYYIDQNGVILSDKTTRQDKYPTRCNTSHFDSDTLSVEKLNNYFCVDNTYQFGGDWQSDKIIIPFYYISYCNSNTEERYGIKCSSPKEFSDAYNNSLYFSMKIQKDLVDPSKLLNPITKSFNYEYFHLDLKVNKKIQFRYNIADIVSDVGVIFQDQFTTNFLEFDSYFLQTLSNVYDDDVWEKTYAVVQLGIIRRKTTYQRRYLKIPDVLATVGGFMSVAFTVIKIVYFPIWDNDLWYYLQKELYNLEVEMEEDNENIVLKNLRKAEDEKSMSKLLNRDEGEKAQFKRLENLTKRVNELEEMNQDSKSRRKSLSTGKKKIIIGKNLLSKDDIVLNKEIKKIIEFNRIKRTPIVIDKWWRFYYLYLTCNVKRRHKKDLSKLNYEMLKAANTEFLKKIEVLEIFKFFDQFKLLLKIVLNKNQSFMLQNRVKQVITNVGSQLNAKEIEIINQEKLEKKILSLFSYVKERKLTAKLNDVDTLLFDYLNDDIKSKVGEMMTSIMA